jgi:hypothetical protein
MDDKQNLIPANLFEVKALEQIAQAIRELTKEVTEIRSDIKKVILSQSKR